MASGLGADERGDLGLEPLQGGTRGVYASGVDGKWAECDILITIPSARVPVHDGALLIKCLGTFQNVLGRT